ncbi:hypothetical protein BN14_09803 [Rhizoctonia solani AG-1 IB]|uniref:Uncharacterized protein n=1 Tax=Thanatephorus cucumeris (strain AG1-IB / isolate 7/3/14) TaxID=1108050 RepID=M5C9H1_THACB|nr:hypothetical protein BN14_09803 [Rhizoctonia solani AG-1 IB]
MLLNDRIEIKAVHHFNYPVSEIRETKKIHVPPKLPPDIPEELHNVIGPPTDEQMKAVHHALRCVEDRSNVTKRAVPELFDADLNMRLSQHLFDLQFARYMQYSAHLTSTDRSMRPSVGGGLNLGYPPEEETLLCPPKTGTSEGLQAGFERMEQAVKELHETMKGAKDILECVNRVLVSTQRSQTMVGSFDQKTQSTIHVNPVNKEGVLATVSAAAYGKSVPNLLEGLRTASVPLLLKRYLKFFEIGSDLVQGEDNPDLINGTEDKATRLLFKHIGIDYNGAQYYRGNKN